MSGRQILLGCERLTAPAPAPALKRTAAQFRSARIYVPLVVCLVVTGATTWLLYARTQQLFRWTIDQRMLELAAVAASSFRPEDLDAIAGPESVGTPAYEAAVEKLQLLRQQTSNLRFAYILRPSASPDHFEFVADADSLHPDQPIDLNGDGAIDDGDALTWPGEPYDVREFPEFRDSAFLRPFVDPEIVEDPWGSLLAGTAPILNPSRPSEPARYVLGLDLDVSEFESQKNTALLPFVAFIAFLAAIITALMLIVERMWRRQVRQLAEIDRQKDELIGIVAHQLGGPVTSLRWSLEGLAEGDLGELAPAHQVEVGHLIARTVALSEQVSALLDVTRVELGRMRVNKQPLDLGQFLRELLDGLRVLAKEKGVELRVELPPSFPPATLDARLTRTTLDNLINNAIKYTPTGGVVTVSATVAADRLRCIVRDTGVGIPKAEQGQLFTKLFRASNAQKLTDGNGLGLYIAKGAAEQQGGSLRFESMEGKGTTFFVDLPLS